MTIDRLPTRLFDQVAHRRALVQQPKVAILIVDICRVSIDASHKQHSMDFADEAAYVAAGVGLARGRRRSSEMIDVVLQLVVPKVVIAFVERVDLSQGWNLDVVMSQDKFPIGRVQSEGENSFPNGDCEDNRA